MFFSEEFQPVYDPPFKNFSTEWMNCSDLFYVQFYSSEALRYLGEATFPGLFR